MAIAAMVLAILALPASCFSYGVGGLVLGLLGAIFGHVARRQIRQRDEQGGGMALTGVILGWISVGISLLYLIAMILFFVYGIDYLNQLDQQSYNEYSGTVRGMLVGWLH
jgi:hypothetical protein